MMKFLRSTVKLAILNFVFTPLTEAQQCLNDIGPVSSGKQCPCVEVHSDCTITDTRTEYDDIRGKKCSNLNVRSDSNGNFPVVDVKYSWHMCNGNAFDIELREPFAKMFDWTVAEGDKAKNVANPRIPLGGTMLRSGECIEREKDLSLSTASRYNVATQLEGFVLDENGNRKDSKTDYCYAYRSSFVNIKRGLCIMETNAECKIAGTDQDCQAFIDENPGCVDFNTEFRWEACNREPRDMVVISKASNVKISRTIENGSRSNEVIGRVQDLGRAGSPNECQNFSQSGTYNTCSDKKLFFSVNVQGTNQKGLYRFECQDFTFVEIKFNPIPSPSPSYAPSMSNEPSISQHPSLSSVPSVSSEPSLSSAPSDKPSAAPSLSIVPSESPSVSTSPSFIPSFSVAPSLQPSFSSAPSESPSSSQEPSIPPSLSMVPSDSPSLSSGPSTSPSVSKEPSLQPSVSSEPSSVPSLSMIPSSVSNSPSSMPSLSAMPSVEPSVSSKPSLSPSESSQPSLNPIVSDKPSLSDAPSKSQEPSLSHFPSGIPSLSQKPSLSQFPSEIPSLSQKPSVSQKPSLRPSVGKGMTKGTKAPHSSITGAPHSKGTKAPHSSITGAPHSKGTKAPHSSITGAPHSKGTKAPHSSITRAPHSKGTKSPLPLRKVK